MPINSTLDVIIQEDDLVVLGPPSTVDISLDIGAQGDPGSQIYTGAFDPNSITTAQFNTLYGTTPSARDLFLRTDVGLNYGTFYSYVNVPGGEQWEPVLEIIDAVEIFLNANTDFVLSASSGGTGVNNGSSTFTFGGDIEFAGPYSATFNLQGNTNITLPTSGSAAVWQDKLNVFAPTTSAELASVITDETGTGLLVFNTSPNISTSITTSDSSFNLINSNATTVNFAGAATNLTIGANEAGTTHIRTAATNLTGDLRVGGGDLTVTETTFNLANTTATTVNFAGAATELNIGAATGTTTINNDLVVDGDLTVNGSTTVINSTITSLDDPVLILGGDTIPTSDDNKDRGIEFKWHDGTNARMGFFGFDDSTGRFTFIPDATSVAEVFSGNAGDIEVGDVIANDLAVNGGDITTSATTFNLVNDTATTVNFAGQGTDIQIGSSTGTTNINNDLDVDGDVNIDGGDLTVSTSNFNLINTNATNINFAGAATGLSIGASTGLTTINNDLLVSASHLATVDAAQFTTAPGVSASVGRLIWNDDDGTLDLGLKGGNVTLQVGQEFVARAFNNSASVINNGDVVVIDGAQGQRVSINLADASSTDSNHAFGVATETINPGEEGFITTQGTVRNVSTYIDGTSEGAEIYLSPDTPGAWTTTRPAAPDHAVRIGWIQREHAASGSLYVQIDVGNHLEWLHDVLITSENDNDVLRYNSSSGIWVNEDISTVVNSASVINAQNINVSGDLDVNGTITGDVTGDLTGNADTATSLETARTIALIGDVSGSASFDGTSDINISVSVEPDSVALGTDTTGNYVESITGTTNEIEVSGSGESATVQIGLPNDVQITNDLTVGGNLTVSGSVVYLNVEELLIEDNIITLNSNVSASPTLNAGIEVERGTETNTSIRWNETLDVWEFTNDGTNYNALGSGEGGFTNHFLMMGA